MPIKLFISKAVISFYQLAVHKAVTGQLVNFFLYQLKLLSLHGLKLLTIQFVM